MEIENNLHTPTTEAEVIAAVELAHQSNKSIHCYSGGFNWGYGTIPPQDPSSIQMNLGRMNQIHSFDKELGILRIGPGVTQGQLFEFLDKNGFDYYIPNTGAGHRGSILGNALERGFGISPIQDHASSILSVRGVLSDGTIYESALKEIDPKLAECFHWGVGPQLDKMVSQSSWLIITEVSIQLKKKYKATDILLFSFSDGEFEKIISAVRNLMSEDEGNIGSVKIFNRRQVINQNDSKINKMLFNNDEWFMTIVVYSHPITRGAVLKLARQRLRSFTKAKISTMNARKVVFLISVLSMIPLNATKEYAAKLKDLFQMIKLAEGLTSEVGYRALDIDFDYLNDKEFDFKNFNKELVWFSPICPLIPERARELITLTKKLNTHDLFRFNTYTWTVLNQRTLALVIPILYDKNPPEDFWKWYEGIHFQLKQQGFIPYRFHNKMLGHMRNELLPKYFSHVKKFENAMDPTSMILRRKKS